MHTIPLGDGKVHSDGRSDHTMCCTLHSLGLGVFSSYPEGGDMGSIPEGLITVSYTHLTLPTTPYV